MYKLNLLEGNFGAGLQRVTATPLRVYKADILISVLILAIMAVMVIVGYL